MFIFNTVVIATHRRSGTQLAIDALRRNSPDISDTYMSLEQIETNHDASIPLVNFRRQLLSLEGQVLINMHDLPTAEHWQGLDERLFVRTILRNSPIIYVHRDGRDVLASLYYYMKSISETVRNQSFSQFLHGVMVVANGGDGMSRPAYWAYHINSWLAKENLLAVAYRDLETDYDATVQRMAAFLNVKLNPRLHPVNALGGPEDDGMIDNVLGRLGVWRRRGGRLDHPRVGKSGDWRRLFDRRDKEFFMKEAGDTLRDLGYEN
ncbi:MAG: sulfotransferase domain-containing protein [Chloroflexi bacterium]|nr:sulfotransferase domain-containing protein [Chloroflexota bacterium]